MTSGEGGMVSCADDELVRSVQLLRNQGMERQYDNEVVGLNNRMTDMHAAIGRVQLTKVGGWTATRQAQRRVPRRAPRGRRRARRSPTAPTHVYHQYTIRVTEDRDEVVRRAPRGVPASARASTTRSRTTGWSRSQQFAPGLDLPETERAAARGALAARAPVADQADLERIVEAVNTVAKAGA